MNAVATPLGLPLTRGELVGESVRRELRDRHKPTRTDDVP